MKHIYRYILIITGSVAGLLLIFNLMTPVIGHVMPNEFAKSELVIDSLKSDNFKPEVLAFGSSLVQTGVNGYILRKELNNDHVYNLAGPAHDLSATCSYFPLLPSTVKTVIIGTKIEEFATESNIIKSSSVHDSLFQAYISVRLNPAKQFWLVENFKNRGRLKAGIQIFARGILDSDAPGGEAMSIVYPYLYQSNRTPSTYQRDVFAQNANGNILSGQNISSDYIELLKRTKEYFNSRGIDFIVFLSPKSPDVTFTTEESTRDFISQIAQSLPEDLHFINCFYSLDSDDFYDSEHPNRLGAEKISKILAQYILQQGEAL
jgi:hypothetical protein